MTTEWQIWAKAAPTFGLMLLAGCCLAASLWRGASQVSLWELLGFGWVLGAGTCSLCVTLLTLIMPGPWIYSTMAAGILVASGWAIWRQRLWQRVQLWPAPGTRAVQCLSMALLLGSSGYYLASALDVPLYSDGVFNNEVKAYAAFQNGGQFPVRMLQDPTRTFFRPAYPLMTPALELWLYLGCGEPHQAVAKTLFAPFAVAALSILFGAACRFTGQLSAGLLAILLLTAVPILFLTPAWLDWGFNDPLFSTVYLGAAVAICSCPARTGSAQWPLAWMLAGILPWLKSEGVIVGIVLALVSQYVHGREAWRRSLALLGVNAGIGAAWSITTKLLQVAPEGTFRPLNLTSLQVAVARVPQIAATFGNYFVEWVTWGALWPALLLASLACLQRPTRREVLPWVLLVVGPLLLYTGPYFFTALSLAWHLSTSAPRLMGHTAWVAVMALTLALFPRLTTGTAKLAPAAKCIPPA